MTMKFLVCGHYYVCDMTVIVIVATRKSRHDPLLCYHSRTHIHAGVKCIT